MEHCSTTGMLTPSTPYYIVTAFGKSTLKHFHSRLSQFLGPGQGTWFVCLLASPSWAGILHWRRYRDTRNTIEMTLRAIILIKGGHLLLRFLAFDYTFVVC